MSKRISTTTRAILAFCLWSTGLSAIEVSSLLEISRRSFYSDMEMIKMNGGGMELRQLAYYWVRSGIVDKVISAAGYRINAISSYDSDYLSNLLREFNMNR